MNDSRTAAAGRTRVWRGAIDIVIGLVPVIALAVAITLLVSGHAIHRTPRSMPPRSHAPTAVAPAAKHGPGRR